MNTRVPSVPLITHDPYFSIWSPADHLYDTETVHWTGQVKQMKGVITVDGKQYRFMGIGSEPVLIQTALEINATSSNYTFEGAGIQLELHFLSPLLLSDLDLLSRPVSYIGIKLSSIDGKSRDTEVFFTFNSAFCKNSIDSVPFIWGEHILKGCQTSWMGRRHQSPLGHSGDNVTIDWGYLHLAVPEGRGQTFMAASGEDLCVSLPFSGAADESFCAVAYDDIVSINYFGDFRRAYWARNGKTILRVIEEAIADYHQVNERCAAFDRELGERAAAAVDPGAAADYQLICNLSYRQTIAAHKLTTDENGEILFISKECFSNGCAATVDVSYPSVPLYLLCNPELVKGMLRPIFRFAKMPVWTYSFPPHDAGRYPHITGQVYGLRSGMGMKNTESYPPLYTYPENTDIYDIRSQMPVEECGNMLIMMASIARAEGNADFSKPYQDLARQWACYLVEFGANPGEQLCTDDFAGHLASNCNLSAKAIMGLASYAMLLELWGESADARRYRQTAETFAEEWKRTAARGDHSALVFDREEGWSLKYNLVWDVLLGFGLFDESFFESEIQWYIKMHNSYGVPLDSRRDYSKSDWILWAAAFTKDRVKREILISPIAAFLRDSPDRVPFSDWYDTVSAKHYHFLNRTVQGGLFMPLLADSQFLRL